MFRKSQNIPETSVRGRAEVLDGFGSPTWARTRDLRINSPSLYRLSYRGSDLTKAAEDLQGAVSEKGHSVMVPP
jgi:hypothetical protein